MIALRPVTCQASASRRGEALTLGGDDCLGLPRSCVLVPVVFQKWRWTAIAVTLGLIFVASLRKEWPMTFIGARR